MQAGQSIERARLFDRTERLAITDGLTGLTNHRTFQERLEAQLAQAQRYGKRVSLLLCDVDHFKSVNDTYGHPVGDEVLRGLARTLAKEARATDVVARYGGEEFAIVMPETDAAGALVIAERIRDRVARLVFETGQGPLRVTHLAGDRHLPGRRARQGGAGRAGRRLPLPRQAARPEPVRRGEQPASAQPRRRLTGRDTAALGWPLGAPA